MKNEYGENLDRNGYAPSIVGDEGRCVVCGKRGEIQRHEVYHGPNREKSKNLGLWVPICRDCHDKVHHKNDGLDMKLKVAMQGQAMVHYKWTVEEFRKRFGKSYI